jgi:nucleoside-diphosphate-sugar epimerase
MSRDGVLLLGGAGFIDSALARRLQQEEAPTVTVGRQDVARLAQALPQCSTVIHLASASTPAAWCQTTATCMPAWAGTQKLNWLRAWLGLGRGCGHHELTVRIGT